jgi:hypothetical protein
MVGSIGRTDCLHRRGPRFEADSDKGLGFSEVRALSQKQGRLMGRLAKRVRLRDRCAPNDRVKPSSRARAALVPDGVPGCADCRSGPSSPLRWKRPATW